MKTQWCVSHLTEKVMANVRNVIRLGFDKTYDAIRSKYYRPNLYRQVHDYVAKCVDCQTRNMQKIKSPLKEVDSPPFQFAKMAIDMVESLPKILSGNWLLTGTLVIWRPVHMIRRLMASLITY